MRIFFSPRRLDLVDGAAAVVMAAAALFVVTFFCQASAGAAGGEDSYLARLRQEAEKRITREREQVAFLLDKEEIGKAEEAWEEGLAAASRLEGNSQFHLFLARGYRERGMLGPSIGEYRKAVEINRDYTDHRSPYYRGKVLRAVVREARSLYLEKGRPRTGLADAAAAVRDLFYLERSLAGGC
jgi:tetratricopeptide (TPR) repeat protein